MSEMTSKERAITHNYASFERKLAELLPEKNGQYALLRHAEIVSLHETAGEAMKSGKASFDDGLFSVQRVEEGSINLGYFSYARYCRVA